MFTWYAGHRCRQIVALSSWSLAMFSHQQVSRFDALGQLTCCSQRTDWHSSGLIQTLNVLSGCKQIEEWEHQFVFLCSPTYSKSAGQALRLLWRAYVCMDSAVSSASCDCAYCHSMAAAAEGWGGSLSTASTTRCRGKSPSVDRSLLLFIRIWPIFENTIQLNTNTLVGIEYE